MHRAIAPAGSFGPETEREAVRTEAKRQLVEQFLAGFVSGYELERALGDLGLADA